MLNTLISATFEYRGHVITANRFVDNLSGNFYCWEGYVDNYEKLIIADESLDKFEKVFISLVDRMEDDQRR